MKDILEELRQALQLETPVVLGDGTAVSWLTDKGEAFEVINTPLIQVGDWLVVKREAETS